MQLSNYWWHENSTKKIDNFPLYFFQESPVVYEAAADCIIALLVRLEDHDNSPFMSALELNVFTTVRRLEVRISLKKVEICFQREINIKSQLPSSRESKRSGEDSKNIHFDLHILPTNLNGTYVCYQETDIMSKKTQNCVV